MSVYETFLEQWQQCCTGRYKTLLVIPESLAALPDDIAPARLAETVQTELLDFKERYSGRLDQFFTWQTIRNEIYKEATARPILVRELELFYAKWEKAERLAFLKNLLQSEPVHPVLILIICQEDLSPLKAIAQNSRGPIWIPPC